MVCCLLSEWRVATSFYQTFANHVFSFCEIYCTLSLPMPKKKLPQTIEECNAELERTQKLLQQYENRNKMLNRKLSAEKRRERNHRTFL